MLTTQRLKRIVDSDYDIAELYYSTLSSINNLRLTDREISLLAFMATSPSFDKKVFSAKHSTTPATINNMISKLKKMYLLTRIDNKVTLNPRIKLNFGNDIKLEISLVHRQTNELVSEKLPD